MKVYNEMPINAPWKIEDREKVWTKCYNWIQKQKGVQIINVSSRANVVEFYLGDGHYKVYLPYQDTGLQTVILNRSTLQWKEIFSTKELKKIVKP